MKGSFTDLGPKLVLGARIGSGASGEVFEAEQIGTCRTVAVKQLRQFAGAESRRRFTREAQVMALVAHPNIVPVLMHGMLNGAPALVMERIKGVDLAELLKTLRGKGVPNRHRSDRLGALVDVLGGQCKRWEKGTPWWQVAAQITADIARAVDHAHQAGVIHRDIKPSNVLISEGGDALLTDFGIAVESDGAEQLAGSTSGSIGYTAPELFSSGIPSAASDVYSLGQLARELATLQDPTPGAGPGALLVRAPRGSKGMPRGFGAILERATAPDPEARYSTSGDLARDLERAIAGEPVLARAPGLLERVARVVAPYRMGLFAGAALVVAAVGAPSVVAAQRLRSAHRTHAAAEAADLHLGMALDRIAETLLEGGAREFQGKPLLDRRRRMLLAKAVDLTGDLVSAAPRDLGALESKAWELRARSLVELSSAEYRLGSFADAIEHLTEGKALVRHVVGLPRRSLGWRIAYLDVALAHALGDWDTAEARGEYALGLIRGGPGNIHVAHMRANIWNVLVESALAEPDVEKAIGLGGRALEEARRVAEADPEGRISLLRVMSNYGAALGNAGKTTEAMALNREALELVQELERSNDLLQLESTIQNNQGGILRIEGRLGEAEACELKALEAQDARLAASPDSVPFKFAVARSLFRLGLTRVLRGDTSEAAQDPMVRSAGLADELCLRPGARWRAHELRASVYDQRGRLAFEAKDYATALELMEEALVSCERCNEIAPDHPGMEFLRARVWYLRTTLVLSRWPREESVTELERFADAFSKNAAMNFQACVFFSILSTRLDKKEVPGSGPTVEAYQLRAVECLRRAIELGYKDQARILTDPNLAVFRDREDAREVMRLLE